MKTSQVTSPCHLPYDDKRALGEIDARMPNCSAGSSGLRLDIHG
jgi:hypothetical protein